MEYLNITTAFLMSPEYRGCEPVDRATWLSLAGFCGLMENGGRIEGCGAWKPRRCEMTLGVTRPEMLRECDLWSWDGYDLIVHFYPAEQEAIVIRKRCVARANGKKGGRPTKTHIGTNMGSDIGSDVGTRQDATPEPISEPTSESVKEGKGKEENTTTTAREAESLLAACPRPSLDRPALEAAADCLRRHRPAFGFERILAGVQAVTAAVSDWPADERLAYLPTAANFFRDDLWRRHPDEWKSRREPRKRLSANGGKPTLTDEELAARLGGRA